MLLVLASGVTGIAWSVHGLHAPALHGSTSLPAMLATSSAGSATACGAEPIVERVSASGVYCRARIASLGRPTVRTNA